MKNLFYTAIAFFAFSGIASASNLKTIVKPKVLLPVTICYVISTIIEEPVEGVIKVTKVYRCRTFEV